ncbi:hypothetical protein pb186bvf_007945 [Paramecium bursaria]
MNKGETNPNQIKAESMKRRLSIFQKYGLIRLNDLFHRQLSTVFKEIKTKKNLVQTPQTQEVLQIKYSVSIELVRPKLKGEPIIDKGFDVSNLKTKGRKSIKKINFESFRESINLIEASQKTKEMDTEIQNIKQLLLLQSVQRQKLTTPQVIIKSQRKKNHLYILSILIVIVLICLDC